MESKATDKPAPREITALLSDERLIRRETQRAVTPFGGIAVFICGGPPQEIWRDYNRRADMENRRRS